jgi:hypothetical protein
MMGNTRKSSQGDTYVKEEVVADVRGAGEVGEGGGQLNNVASLLGK